MFFVSEFLDYTATAGGASTRLDGQISAGATSLTVDSSSGFEAGDTVRLSKGETVQELVVISAIPSGGTTLTVNATKNAHADNATVDEVLTKISTLNPREPERNINSTITVDFDTTPSGTVYGFADALKNYDSADPVITVGSTDHEVQTDPYLRRSRVLFTFSGADTVNINFNLDDTYQVGSLVFFKEDAILRTSSSLFLTYPFQVRMQPRVLTINRVDGSVLERALDDEPLVRMTMNIIPASDYSEFTDSLDRLFEIISPRAPFLYVGEENPWDAFLLKRTPNRQIDHNRQGTNRQSITALNLEVA